MNPIFDTNANDPDSIDESPAESAARERRIQAKAALLMGDAAWWKDELDGFNVTIETSAALSECAPYVNAAMKEMVNVPLSQLGSTLVVLRTMDRLCDAMDKRARKQAEREFE